MPEVLNGVQSDQRCDEESNPLDAAYATNGNSGEHQPETPLRREWVMLLTVELGPAEDGGEGEAEEHRIEKDETADGGVRVLAEYSQRDEPYNWTAEVQLLGGKVCQRNADSAKSRVEETHEGVVQLRRVGLSRLEFERAIVSSEVSRQTDEHLSERWVDIEVELALEVV